MTEWHKIDTAPRTGGILPGCGGMTDIITASKGRRIAFDYRNHRGEVGARRTECSGSAPIWGSTEWHPEPQWFLPMFDLDRKAWRDFAMRDMRNVQMDPTP